MDQWLALVSTVIVCVRACDDYSSLISSVGMRGAVGHGRKQDSGTLVSAPAVRPAEFFEVHSTVLIFPIAKSLSLLGAVPLRRAWNVFRRWTGSAGHATVGKQV
jgi:hypothetical protein